METWQNIIGYETFYKISSLGTIINLQTNKEIKKRINADGYYVVSLNQRSFLVHRLLAINFISNSENKAEVNHKDGNKLNNALSNLEWLTQKENLDHATVNGLRARGERVNTAILNEKQVIEIREKYIPRKVSMMILAKEYGVSKATICHILTRKNWKHTLLQ
jgi:hypothetical protein